jgi:hypothetical protein
MSWPGIRSILVSELQMEELARLLGIDARNAGQSSEAEGPLMNDDLAQLHLTDDLFVGYSMKALTPAISKQVERHLGACNVCAGEIARIEQLSAIWRDESKIARLEQRVRSTMKVAEPTVASGARHAIEAGLAAFVKPFTVSLQPLMRPQGAYGETKEDETSTLEFFITQEGKIIEGLRGLLKRVNREYYVRIFAVDPGARTEFGDRKAVISISDTYQDRPILHRRIDVGVTVLLGTDFPLTESSCLAVEMLPPYN